MQVIARTEDDERLPDGASIAAAVARLTISATRRLEQQAATSEILSITSRSPADVRPVLYPIVRAAVKLPNPYDAGILLRDSDRLLRLVHGRATRC